MPERQHRRPSRRALRPLRVYLRAIEQRPSRLVGLLLLPGPRYLFSWLVAVAAAIAFAVTAWMCWDSPERGDGNWGHATIDFGGQWVFARTLVEGHGRHLYSRNYLRMVAEEHYPTWAMNPDDPPSDADKLLDWMMPGNDNPEGKPEAVGCCVLPLGASSPLGEAAVLAAGPDLWTEESLAVVTAPRRGGPLYPPIHALLFSPLATLPPRVSYRVVQALTLLLAFFNGWVIARMTRGRIWWPVAALGLMLFPGFGGAIDLGQNAVVSLTFLLTGWWQLMRGRPLVAGLLWGLLAYKPVWAVCFFLVPVLTGRWRMALSMGLTGLAQIALTLPLVGVHSWLDWVAVGRHATWEYTRQQNWIVLSRDLQGLSRRWLLTFENSLATDPEQPLANRLALGLWLGLAGLTLAVALWRLRRIRALEGPYIAFLLLGVYFSCFHFMYYDVMLASLPLCLLFTDPAYYLRPVFWPGSPPGRDLLPYFQPRRGVPPVPLLPGGRRFHWVLTPAPPLLLALLIGLPCVYTIIDASYRFPPVDTFCLLLFWAWAGVRTAFDRDVSQGALVDAPSAATPGPNGDGASDISPEAVVEKENRVRPNLSV
jgi:hypothetical protein